MGASIFFNMIWTPECVNNANISYTLTNIEFDLYSWGFADLIIYNIMGQKVREIASQRVTAGINTIIWDGMNDDGSRVSSGVYLYRLKTSDNEATRKMILVK